MKWLEYPKTKPKEKCLCYVFNCDCGLNCYQAIYHSMNDIFELYDPNYREMPPLAVTHYIELPDPFFRD